MVEYHPFSITESIVNLYVTNSEDLDGHITQKINEFALLALAGKNSP